jgi:hypothetical protein
MQVTTIVLVFCSLAPLASAQRTWTVDWLNRPGTDFAEIQPAVDAAASGDTILVRGAGRPITLPPSGHGYANPVIDGKGLTIVGEGRITTWVGQTLPLEIRNLQPGQTVILSNFRLGSIFVNGTPDSSATLIVENNAGTVLLDRLEVNGFWGGGADLRLRRLRARPPYPLRRHADADPATPPLQRDDRRLPDRASMGRHRPC